VTVRGTVLPPSVGRATTRSSTNRPRSSVRCRSAESAVPESRELEGCSPRDRQGDPAAAGPRVQDHHGRDDFRVQLGIIRVIVGYVVEHTSRRSRAELRSADGGNKETWRPSHKSRESLTSSQHRLALLHSLKRHI